MWGKEDSKHSFGASAFGISDFSVTFSKRITYPINIPPSNGFIYIESDYMLLQIGLTYAYQITDQLLIGMQPNFY
ncbi:MAG: long-chain fatty acid transport protein [bacterium]|jgi:long-chain fatty acid transport protein